MNSIITIYH